MLSELTSQLCLDFPEIQWLEGNPRTTVDPRFVPDDMGPKGLGEPACRLAEITLEELHNRRGEIQLFGSIEDVLLREGVGSHPLSEVSDDL